MYENYSRKTAANSNPIDRRPRSQPYFAKNTEENSQEIYRNLSFVVLRSWGDSESLNSRRDNNLQIKFVCSSTELEVILSV